MEFIEESTPNGMHLKIILNSWQFLAFDKKGKSIFDEQDGQKLLHHVPLIIFLGEIFNIKRPFDREYHLLKIRNGDIILPYIDNFDSLTKYVFIPNDKKIDLIPARIMQFRDLPTFIKAVDVNMAPDYIIVDNAITANDEFLVMARYKKEELIHLDADHTLMHADQILPDNAPPEVDNLNTLSTNPVFLARIHLRVMDFAKVNQLLLDFELTALDTEYIIKFIEDILTKKDDPVVIKRQALIEDLRDSFIFYLYLLQRNDEDIKKIILQKNDLKILASFRTLISKAKSLYPGTEEQMLYTDYENLVMDRLEEMKG